MGDRDPNTPPPLQRGFPVPPPIPLLPCPQAWEGRSSVPRQDGYRILYANRIHKPFLGLSDSFQKSEHFMLFYFTTLVCFLPPFLP